MKKEGMRMTKYVLKRLVYMVIVFLLVSLLMLGLTGITGLTGIIEEFDYSAPSMEA